MATTYDITNAIDGTAADNFLPEIWATEIVAAYKSQLVLGNLVKQMNHLGKPGDRINVQRPDRNSAAAKVENNFVTLQTHTDTQVNVDLTSHWEYSVLLEDIAELQSVSSLRSIYTEDAGYALAKRIDTSLHAEAATAGGGTAYSKAVIGSDGSTAWSDAGSGNGTAIADAGVRRVIQTFEDNDTPSADRYLVIPPVAANTLRGITRFSSEDFNAGGVVPTGNIGNLYGVEVFTSSNCATVEANDSTAFRVALMFQKNSIVLAKQQDIRVQSQYQLNALGTLLVADVLYGSDLLRGDTIEDLYVATDRRYALIGHTHGPGGSSAWTEDQDAGGFGLDNLDRLEIQDAGASGSGTFTHDGSDFNLAFGNTTNFNLIALTSNFWIRDGAGLKISDAGDTDFGVFSHDGTDFNTAFTNTTDWNITGLTAFKVGNYNFNVNETVGAGQDNYVLTYDNATGEIGLEAAGGGTPWTEDIDGGGFGLDNIDRLEIQASGVATDTATFTHDGTDFNTAFANTTDWNIKSARLKIMPDGTNIDVQTQSDSGTGNTTALQVRHHSNQLLDVGLNVLPRASDNNSNITLAAQHCGAVWDKTNTTAYTVTLEASSSTDFPVEGIVTLMNKNSTGNVTISEGTGTTLYHMDGVSRTDSLGSLTLGPGGVCTIRRAAAGTYDAWGSNLS
jgi:hypothetical protein